MRPATTIVKVCRVMDQFQDRQPLGITDLARRTGLLPSDVHRIVRSLLVAHYLDQDPETKKYRLGFVLVRLGLTAFRGNMLREKARPILAQVSKRLGATTHLALFDSDRLELRHLDLTNGPTAAMLPVHLGEVEHLHCTAIGKAVLASLDQRLLASALQKSGLPRLTCETITDARTLAKQLEEVRRFGYASDREELKPGICCVGSPIRDHGNAIVGAISASIPAPCFFLCEEPHVGAILKAAADDLSAAISASR